ncbi:amidohydrolase [Vagococcus xieshaowenii]|uniref:Amidohydrolase n=1 Tax=Vagococcus xieshaowenii TaxID=2562451 RepID=A0AAJ5EFY6_9ENTE|nr:amidohydrolase [Vagococcus xieshaowenii]QCA28878.1 amidohydrolase [Vagococcus xieshaowenii]TFZ43295.1 amidohydrolase [Vagococcus xieshaowenii]
MNNYINKFLEDNEKKMISIRRYLHENPELSFNEFQTSNYIYDYYSTKDCLVEKDPNSNGIVVTINGQKPGNVIGIRADFDALAILEETGLSFSSKNNGVMHACGHDGHTAYLMVLAEALITYKDKWNGTIKIIHQAAEEIPPGGAQSIINSGLVDDVDFFIGAHLWSLLPLGTISCTPGSIMTRRDHFSVLFKGCGGHGSAPHLAKDTNLAVAFFQTAVQSIISRRVDPLEPATLTIGSVEGSGSFNVIQETVKICGDIRTFNSATSKKIKEEFVRILKGISIMFDIEFELDYNHDYEEVYNDPIKMSDVTNIIRDINISNHINILTDYRVTASEDFCYYRTIAPSCFLLVGAKPENEIGYPHHHPKFNIDEGSLLLISQVIGEIVLKLMEKVD